MEWLPKFFSSEQEERAITDAVRWLFHDLALEGIDTTFRPVLYYHPEMDAIFFSRENISTYMSGHSAIWRDGSIELALDRFFPDPIETMRGMPKVREVDQILPQGLFWQFANSNEGETTIPGRKKSIVGFMINGVQQEEWERLSGRSGKDMRFSEEQSDRIIQLMLERFEREKTVDKQRALNHLSYIFSSPDTI